MLTPPVPGPFAAATMFPLDGRIATSAEAGPTSGEQPLGGAAGGRDPGWSRSVSPGVGLGPEQLALPAVGGPGVHHEPGRAGELLVVPRLQPGQAGHVADPEASGVLLDHLRGHLTDPAQDRRGELGGGGQRGARPRSRGHPRSRSTRRPPPKSRRPGAARWPRRRPPRLRPRPAVRTPRGRGPGAGRGVGPTRPPGAGSTWVRSMPKRTTGRSVTRRRSPAPAMSPRGGCHRGGVQDHGAAQGGLDQRAGSSRPATRRPRGSAAPGWRRTTPARRAARSRPGSRWRWRDRCRRSSARRRSATRTVGVTSPMPSTMAG